MELTLAQLCSMVTTLNQGRTDLTLSEVSRHVNMAASEIAVRIPMRSLEQVVTATVSADSDLAVPATSMASYQHVLSISNLSQPANSPLRTLEPTTVQWMDSQGTGPGTPTHYATFGWDTLRVWPSADTDTVLQVRALARLPVVTGSSNTFNVDPKWYPAIAYRAAAIAASERNDVEQEGINQARYLSFVNSTPSDLETKQRQVGGFGVRLPERR